MPDQADKWTCEYPQGPLVHHQWGGSSGIEIEWYQCIEDMVNFAMLYFYFKNVLESAAKDP